MGVLCEVYIADSERALKYDFRGECKCKSRKNCKCWNEYAPETYDRLESHRIYNHDFAQLLSILRNKLHRDSVLEEFKMLKESSADGPWIESVPDALPELLAEATSKELKSIAETWAELKDNMYPVDNELILDYLKLLQGLCKKSIKKGQSMYLWTSL